MAQIISKIKERIFSSHKNVYLINYLRELHISHNGFAIHNSTITLTGSINSSTLLKIRMNSNKRDIKTYFASIEFKVFDSNSKEKIHINYNLFQRIIEKNPQILSLLFNEALIENSDIILFKIVIINPCFRLETSQIELMDFEDKIYLKIFNSVDATLKNHPLSVRQSSFYEEWEHSDGRRVGF